MDKAAITGWQHDRILRLSQYTPIPNKLSLIGMTQSTANRVIKVMEFRIRRHYGLLPKDAR